MHKIYTSVMPTSDTIDFNHYKSLWQRAMIDTTSENLGEKLSFKGVVGSPFGINLNTLPNRDYEAYIEYAHENSVVFIDDYNTFYADSFLTFLKLTSVARWASCIDNLNNSPLHSVKNEPWKQEEFLLVWMFKHNIKHKMLTPINNFQESD